MKKQVLILVGSKSDQPFAEAAMEMLDKLEIGYDYQVSSAHRHPDKTGDLAKTAAANGFRVIICMAGMAAALPGVVAAHSNLPVIGVPLPATLAGVDAILAIAQMPPGIPVATMGIGKAGAKNSAILAARIIGLSDKGIEKVHNQYRESL